MNETLTDGWAREIRDFLLGDLASSRRIELLSPRADDLRAPPVRRWWIFEGKQYPAIEGSLAAHFNDVVRVARRLDLTFNPRLRVSDRPDGDVDWGYTLARGAHYGRLEYVVRSSGIGLDESERAALRGWMKWLEVEWKEYARSTRVDTQLDTAGLGSEVEGPFPIERLRRWAYVARRSRWPLLRGVVAESLRPVLERDELDRIPLPSDPAKLFELLCIVRIARHFSPDLRNLRWLGADVSDNTLRFEDLSCRYQESLRRSDVLAAPDYVGSLARAVLAFDVGVPGFIDVVFDFDEPIGGFNGIIVEAKSGSQQYRDAVSQLRTYRGARQRRAGARYLVWGIVQSPTGIDATPQLIASLMRSAASDEDAWVFSGADSIGLVLNTLFPVARETTHRPLVS